MLQLLAYSQPWLPQAFDATLENAGTARSYAGNPGSPAPTAPDAPLSDDEIAQLESLGYGQ